MERIINGIKFEGKVLPGAWDASRWSANGCTETTVHPRVQWVEIENIPYVRSGDGYKGAATAANLQLWAAQDASDAAKRAAAALASAACRAKQMCRRVIKVEGFDQLLTLTYRDNMVDREVCKKHFKEFIRRMKKALDGFRFCASFELQKRGAWHVHIACHRLPKTGRYHGQKIDSFKLGTRIWRDIIGNPHQGPLLPGQPRPQIESGLCFVGGKTKFGAPGRFKKQSLSAMADYVSKYIMKDFENSPAEKNRYSRSNGTNVPKSEKIKFDGMCLSEVISLMFELPPGHRLISHYLAYDAELWGMTTELIAR